MMLWVLVGVLVLGAVLGIALPVLRARDRRFTRADYDLTVFEEQLRELDRDVERGVLSPAEMESARAEIARRMLAADRRGAQPATTPVQNRGRQAVLALVVVAVPLAATALYAWRGNPGLSGLPTAARQAMPGAGPGGEAAAGLQASIEALRERLAREPGDFDGWVLLGRSYMVTQQPEQAIEAYGRAVALRPDDASLRSFLGEALVFAAGGTVTPAARAAFERARQGDAGDPAARFYLALADAQAGNLRDAFDAWLALAADTPVDAPWLPMLREQLETAADELEVDLAAVMPPPPAPVARGPAPGPTRDDIEAAQEMAPEDREEMIRGMVARLAARLEEEPGDREGWERLARSYRVLGEPDKAAAAQARADALASGAAVPSAPPGPSAEDVAAASSLSADERAEMVEGMVAGLASRLAENPDDREGWLRLARSYQVMGRPDQALEAYEKAASAFPDDAEILQLHARALIEQTPAGAPLATRAFNLYRRVLELQEANLEALYFVGVGEAERDNPAEAERLWTRLLGLLDPESDARRIVQGRLDELRSE